MTRRELALSVGALVVGLIVGALLFERHETPRARRPAEEVSSSDPIVDDSPPAALPESGDADDAEAMPAPEVAVAPGDASAPLREAMSAVPRDAAPEAAPIVIRAANLLIHPGGDPHKCVDAPLRSGRPLQLFRCHGRKNQRWTFAEDITGANRIFGSDGGCVRVGAARAGGEPTLEVGACSPDTPRFRHRTDRRLEEVQSGLCVTVPVLEKRARLVLETCDPSNAGQTWTLTE